MEKFLMVIILFALAAWYILSVFSKFRITSGYLLRLYQLSFPEEQFSADKISFVEIGDEKDLESEYKVYHRYETKAEAANGKQHIAELTIYNPRAELEEKEYKAFTKSARQTDDQVTDSIMSGTPDSPGTAAVDSARNMLQEQHQRELEDKIYLANVLKHEISRIIAMKLADVTDIVPRVYYFDKKKLATFHQSYGTEKLRDHWRNFSDQEKLEAVNKLASGLAKVQSNYSEVKSLLPLRKDMTADDFRNILQIGLEEIYGHKLITFHQVRDLAGEYFLIGNYLSQNYQLNIKFNRCVAGNVFWRHNQPLIGDFDNFDTGPYPANLTEFLKDPVVYAPELEKEALAIYYNILKPTEDYAEFIKYYHLYSCHILTVQLLYMRLYLQQEAKGLVTEEARLENWDEEHYQLLLDNSLPIWKTYPESEAFALKLEDVLNSVMD